MAKYNLIKNSLFSSNTSSGTGNRALTQTELYTLTDGVTTSSGVDISSGDMLYLDIDLHQRIKVNGIFLYANDLTKLANIDFQYKNYIEESYSGCDKNVSNTYTATISDPSAPRFIRCIITGADINLFEFAVYNDDYLINFGEDGTETDTWLDNTPIGTPGIPEAIEIYNNSVELSGPPVNAYVCVDYTGQGRDDFVKISKSYEGTYLGFEHGAITGYEYIDWNSGTYDNVSLNADENSISLIDVGDIQSTYAGYVCDLPLTQGVYTNVTFGVDNAWDWSPDHGKIFAFFWTVNANTGGVLRLYDYDIDTNVWTFRCDLSVVSIQANFVAMCYNDGYIYFRCYGGSSNNFYRHELSGATGNVTTLAAGGAPNSDGWPAICSDKKGVYIYTLCEDVSSSGGKLYFRYDIAANTWWNFNEGSYSTGISHDIKKRAVYDTDRDVIYYYYDTYAYYWVQRYHVIGNYWNTTWFDYGTRIGVDNTNLYIWYHKDKLYFFSPDFNNSYFTYNILTDVVEEMSIPFKYNTNRLAWGIVTDPPTTSSGTFALYSTNIYSDSYGFYAVGTGFERPETEVVIVGAIGTYTTNVIALDDPFQASYFTVKVADTVPQVTTVSADEDLYDGTIEVRSSSSPPTPIDEIYWLYIYHTVNYASIGRYVIGTADWVNAFANSVSGYYYVYSLGVDRRTGRMVVYAASSSHYASRYVYNRSGTILYSSTLGYVQKTYKGIFFDKYKGFWLHQVESSRVIHYTYNFGGGWTATTPDLYAMCSELNGDGVWYTEVESNTVNRLDYSGANEVTIVLGNPKGICSTNDGGCWVSDNNHAIDGSCVRRYDREGNLLNVVSMGNYNAIQLGDDHQSGFYACSDYADGLLWHFDSEGNKTMELTGLYNFYWVRGGRRGVVIHSTTYKQLKYIDLATKSVIWTKRYVDEIYGGGYNNTTMPDIFSWDENTEDMYTSDYGSKILPTSYDTVWYGNDNLEWKEVPKDGYFLPKVSHHQARITLRNYDGVSTPKVKTIAMAPTIIVTDIAAQSSKPMYVRSDIPADTDVSLFVTRLKVWWDLEEN